MADPFGDIVSFAKRDVTGTNHAPPRSATLAALAGQPGAPNGTQTSEPGASSAPHTLLHEPISLFGTSASTAAALASLTAFAPSSSFQGSTGTTPHIPYVPYTAQQQPIPNVGSGTAAFAGLDLLSASSTTSTPTPRASNTSAPRPVPTTTPYTHNTRSQAPSRGTRLVNLSDSSSDDDASDGYRGGNGVGGGRQPFLHGETRGSAAHDDVASLLGRNGSQYSAESSSTGLDGLGMPPSSSLLNGFQNQGRAASTGSSPAFATGFNAPVNTTNGDNSTYSSTAFLDDLLGDMALGGGSTSTNTPPRSSAPKPPPQASKPTLPTQKSSDAIADYPQRKRAVALMEQSKYSEALALLATVRGLSGSNAVDVQVLKMDCLYKMDDYRRCIRIGEMYLSSSTQLDSSQRSKILHYTARAQEAMYDFTAAAKTWAQLSSSRELENEAAAGYDRCQRLARSGPRSQQSSPQKTSNTQQSNYSSASHLSTSSPSSHGFPTRGNVPTSSRSSTSSTARPSAAESTAGERLPGSALFDFVFGGAAAARTNQTSSSSPIPAPTSASSSGSSWTGSFGFNNNGKSSTDTAQSRQGQYATNAGLRSMSQPTWTANGNGGERSRSAGSTAQSERQEIDRKVNAAVAGYRDKLEREKGREETSMLVRDQVDQRVERWSVSKETNLRALLSTLQEILPSHYEWRAVSLATLMQPSDVKKAYMRAVAKCHPDKAPRTATVEETMLAASIFTVLNRAWDSFKTQNGM